MKKSNLKKCLKESFVCRVSSYLAIIFILIGGLIGYDLAHCSNDYTQEEIVFICFFASFMLFSGICQLNSVIYNYCNILKYTEDE